MMDSAFLDLERRPLDVVGEVRLKERESSRATPAGAGSSTFSNAA